MIFVALGSNLGNRLSYLREAVAQLKEHVFSWFETSIILETPAFLKPHTPSEWNKPYLNMVIRGETTLSPHALLSELQKIERALGRPADHEIWAPRTIDLDILLWEDCKVDTPTLQIPHPELLNRPFWLHLMGMLSPETAVPDLHGTTFGDLAHQTVATRSCFTQSLVLDPKLVGVVNITPDSFSDGRLYLNPENAIAQILKLHQAGATVIEVGAQSTRPGAILLSEEEEYERLLPILEAMKDTLHPHEILLSLDSYAAATILKALKHYPIAWVNDVNGDLSTNVLTEIAEYHCSFVAMHSLTIPPRADTVLKDLHELETWAEKTILKLKACGFSESRIILDPGIGYGKSAYQSLWWLEHIQRLKKFGCSLLVGHSRKSYMQAFSTMKASERDLETIAISDALYRAGVDYLRVHDVASHQRFWVAKQAIQSLEPKEL